MATDKVPVDIHFQVMRHLVRAGSLQTAIPGTKCGISAGDK